MPAPYGMELVESCLACKLKSQKVFCNLPQKAIEALESVKHTTIYPKGALLFVQGQAPRGIFILCTGRIKHSISAADGKTLILRIAEPGDVLGLNATVSGKPYELSAETLIPSQVTFLRPDDLLRLMREHSEWAYRVTEYLSELYINACKGMRSLMVTHSSAMKLANLLLRWLEKNAGTRHPERIKLSLTHEDVAQIIGTSRETVTRTLSEFKSRHLVHMRGSTLVIRDRTGLERIASGQSSPWPTSVSAETRV
jgi:CRP/FNR family transcriptional regulator